MHVIFTLLYSIGSKPKIGYHFPGLSLYRSLHFLVIMARRGCFSILHVGKHTEAESILVTIASFKPFAESALRKHTEEHVTNWHPAARHGALS